MTTIPTITAPVLNEVTVSGKVVNEFDDPLVAVHIVASNGKGTITDAKGNYTLNGVPYNGTFTVSHVGYKKETFSPREYPRPIVMQTEVTALDEVVVTSPPSKQETLTPAIKKSSLSLLWMLVIAGTAWAVFRKGEQQPVKARL